MSPTTAILAALHNCDGHPVSKVVLLSEVRCMIGNVGESEFDSKLSLLSSEGMVLPEVNRITGDTYYTITPSGADYLHPHRSSSSASSAPLREKKSQPGSRRK